MKLKIVRFFPEKCQGCMDCEKACSKVHFKVESGGDRSAIRVAQKGDTYEATVCNQCGLCIDLCPVQAIERKKTGTVVVDRKVCIGCQACVGFCPRGVMRKAEGIMEPFKCIACGACTRACPTGALVLEEVELEGIAEVVYHKLG